MLIKKAFVILFLTLIMVSLLKAQEKGIGAGILIGEPTGLSGKYWLDNSRALDFGIGYSFAHTYSALSLHTDIVFPLPQILKSKFLPLYYGMGVRIHINNKDGNTFGARGVLGSDWMFDNQLLDVFIEIAPVFNLLPRTSLHLDLAVGSRYYFSAK